MHGDRVRADVFDRQQRSACPASHHKNEEELKATYTAEATVRRIESQLNRYLAKSDLLKRTIEQGYTLDDEEFDEMAALMLDKDGAVQCIELAKDGTVTQLYPLDQSMVLSMMLALLISVVYWQFAVRRYRDRAYAEEIKRSADAERAANAAKTGFLARMSHDIRTPLNGIIGLLKINEAHADDRALIESNRKKMMVAANHLLALINDVLQMSKLESGEVVLAHEVVNLNELSADIQSIVGQIAADAGVSLRYDSTSDEKVHPYVYGSPLHLRQIFLNIYSNAIKYNRVGGSVTTHLDCFGAANGIVTYRWTITDTGIGMSEEFLQHIFEPFAQERTDARSVYSGTGLGMAIVKTLVDRMHGTITVKSVPNKGSTFVITLSFEIAQVQSSAPQETGKTGSIRGLHLLLAEDNELNAEIAETLLRDEGAEITVVSDGAQAIDRFADSPASTFDAILMDIMMPEVDGLAATRAIRAMERPDAKSIPIIALTANAFNEDAQRCLAAGMNAHLAKPLQMEVVQTISRFCSK